MKKIFLILIVIFLLSACSSDIPKNEEVFEITNEQQEKLNLIINEELQKYLWNYNENETTYELGSIETSVGEKYDKIYNASKDTGLDIKKYEGKEAIVVSTKLFYFNNDEAGQAYFYFINNNLVCEYYVNNGNIYSLNDKYIFVKNKEFAKYEDTNIRTEFTEYDININFESYNDLCQETNTIAVIEDETKINFYKYNDNFSFEIVKSFDFKSEGLYPLDISFNEDGNSVVLLGQKSDISINNSDVNEDDTFIETEVTSKDYDLFKSIKLQFFDTNLNKTGEVLDLNISTYKCLKYNKDSISLVRDKNIDVYKKSNNIWTKSNQFMVSNWITGLEIADIDGDNSEKYIMTDGKDLFIYDFNETLELLWSTHLSIRSMEDDIYISDLNRDGVKEIYVQDLTETTTRYILTPTGFKPYGGQIAYGEKYIPGDFNGDGKDDYIYINNLNEDKKIFIAQ